LYHQNPFIYKHNLITREPLMRNKSNSNLLELQIDAAKHAEELSLARVEQKLSRQMSSPKRKKTLEALLFDAELARKAIMTKTSRKIIRIKTRAGI
jgi:hypothetical protein